MRSTCASLYRSSLAPCSEKSRANLSPWLSSWLRVGSSYYKAVRVGQRLGMPHYAEYGQNTFVGSQAQAQAHVSSPTARGFFAIFAWFDFKEGGGAVLEQRLSVLSGSLL